MRFAYEKKQKTPADFFKSGSLILGQMHMSTHNLFTVKRDIHHQPKAP